jgi:RNA polymerase primary sigma factor
MTDQADERHDASPDVLKAYIKRIRNIPILTRQEEVEYARLVRKGDEEAEQKLVLHNLKYVVHVANRYKGCGLPLIDLINEGNIGLIQAARRFDPERGVKFITYAVWWIRQAIMQALASQSGTVRLPLKQVGRLKKINNKHHDLKNNLCREPTIDELAETLGTSINDVESILRACRARLTLDAPIREGEEVSYLDLLEDTTNPPIEEQIIQNAIAQEVHWLLQELSPREEKILRMRFGFDDTPKTLEQIGQLMNLSRERIRQIEKKAMNSLKARIRLKVLRQ